MILVANDQRQFVLIHSLTVANPTPRNTVGVGVVFCDGSNSDSRTSTPSSAPQLRKRDPGFKVLSPPVIANQAQSLCPQNILIRAFSGANSLLTVSEHLAFAQSRHPRGSGVKQQDNKEHDVL